MNLSNIVWHAAASIGIITGLMFVGVPLWIGALVNAVFWPVRERLQHHRYDLEDFPLQWWLEGMVPVPVGIVFAAVGMWFGLDVTIWDAIKG